MVLVYLAVSWLIGVYLGSLTRFPQGAIVLALLGLALFPLLRNRPYLTLLPVCLLFLSGGAERYWLATPPVDENTLAYYNGKGVLIVRGIVSAEPERYDTYTRLRLDAQEIVTGSQPSQIAGAALVTVPRFPAYRYGDRLELVGKVEEPPEFEDFSYRDYLAAQGIRSLIAYPKAKLLGRSQGDSFMTVLLPLKEQLGGALNRILPEPQASLAVGMLLGDRAGIPRELLDAFTVSGLMHLIAISGQNMVIIAGILYGMASYLLRRRRLLATVVVVIVLFSYTILTGATPSVVRAFIMGSIALLGIYLGRPNYALNGLLVAAFVMTLLNPLILWDVSFQLSFLATVGLILMAPPLQNRLNLIPAWGSSTLAITLAAQLATTPILLYNFQRVSIISLPANLLAIPALPGIMSWGLSTALVGTVFEPLARLTGAVAWLYLTFLIKVAELGALFPFAALGVQDFSLAWGWAYYGVALLVITHRSEPMAQLWSSIGVKLNLIPARITLAFLGLVAIVAIVAAAWPRPAELRLAVLDIGQGDAIMIQTPQGYDILVDGGPKGSVLTRHLGKRMAFWDRTIDLVILTHPQDDHLAGLIDVLERYQVKQVLELDADHPTPGHIRWRELVKHKQVKTTVAQAGQFIQIGPSIYLEVLQAGGGLSGEDINESSIVLKLVVGKTSVLLTGDAGEIAQRRLVSRGLNPDSDILKVPHHGSADSLDPNFLAAVSPEVAIISVGRENRYGHPATKTVKMLEGTKVYRTDINGTVEIAISASGYRIETSK